MAYELPRGYTLVDQSRVESEEWLRLLEEVAATVDSDLVERFPAAEPKPDDFPAEPTGQQVERLAIGVRDDEEVLAAYAGATVDVEEKHATVDTLVVRRIERGLGIGKALSGLIIDLLSTYDVETISFQPYGEIGKLLPYLTEEQGFRYNLLTQEFCSNRRLFQLPDWEIPLLETNDLSVELEDVSLKEEVDEADVRALLVTVEGLVKACVEKHNQKNRIKIYNCEVVLDLERPGQKLEILSRGLACVRECEIKEISPEILPVSPATIVSQRRVAGVMDLEGELTPTFYEDLEIRGADGAMRQYHDKTGLRPTIYTKGYHQKLLEVLAGFKPENVTYLEEI